MGNYQVKYSWDSYSKLIIVSFSVLQIMRWRILPQFMDIFYHILTAWGFIQAGGYSGWDFWQYAPVGRTHIYPPFLHIVLAFLIKSGISKIILVKFLETAAPITCMLTLWYFVKRNYSSRLAFFSMLMLGSSFSFYSSLSNYLPATLAMIFGFLGLDELFKVRFVRPALLFTLCFYTHIGMSWFFALSVILYGLFDKRYARVFFAAFAFALILSAPMLYKQLTGLRYISISGIGNEKYFCEFKTIDYLLAFNAIWLLRKKDKKYRLFLAFFLSSLIFLPYPYRFINAQGYLPIILLSAMALDYLYEKFWDKRRYTKPLSIFLFGYILLFSPTVAMNKDMEKGGRIKYKIHLADSALINLLLPGRNERIFSSLVWLPNEYLSLSQLIRENSLAGDIIYSKLYLLGIIASSLSERASANGLFPEIAPSGKFDPFLVSKLIVVPQDEDREMFEAILKNYHLQKVGENRLFIVYKNYLKSPSGDKSAKMHIERASLTFKAISLILAVWMLLFIFAGRIEHFLCKENRLNYKCAFPLTK
ncbi:MAG: hypothetical protein A3J51_06335 [Omnitrophica WOR_2 bacterium RIFCSPHIGHO2_02_FULL_45_21]|nr:MAG: hypothetical protein A3J51_06335 [Omnitrophica WOR_2 bacterium RIFCSPHIGHO2_02_FULL_45_21]